MAARNKDRGKRSSQRGAATLAPAIDSKISIHEGFELFAARSEPHAARELFNAALRENRIRLWVNDVVVDPNFITQSLVVEARPERDGRWHAEIKPTRALEPGPLAWSVSHNEIETLLRQETAAKRRGGGRTPEFDRGRILAETVAVLLERGVGKQDWIRALKHGLPAKTDRKPSIEDLHVAMRARLGEACPERALFFEILGPLHNHLKSKS